MRFIGFLTTALTVASALCAPPAFCSPPLILNTANAPPNATAEHTGICDRILIEAFDRLNIGLIIVNLPSERALLNANEGIDDGNFARIEGLETRYPNLIRVDEPITTFEFVAFVKDETIRIHDWESLAPYHVGIVTGWKILESNIVNAKSLTKVRNEELLFRLLLDDKVDVAVYDRMQGEVALRRLPAGTVKTLLPPLAVKAMYPYLHRRHTALVPQLEATLRGMRQDGTVLKLRDAALQSMKEAD